MAGLAPGSPRHRSFDAALYTYESSLATRPKAAGKVAVVNGTSETRPTNLKL